MFAFFAKNVSNDIEKVIIDKIGMEWVYQVLSNQFLVLDRWLSDKTSMSIISLWIHYYDAWNFTLRSWEFIALSQFKKIEKIVFSYGKY